MARRRAPRAPARRAASARSAPHAAAHATPLPSWLLPAAVVGGVGALIYFATRRRDNAQSQLTSLFGESASLANVGGGAPARGPSPGRAPQVDISQATYSVPSDGQPAAPITPVTPVTPSALPTSAPLRTLQSRLMHTDCPFPLHSTGAWDDETRMATMWALTQMNNGDTGVAAARVHALDADHGDAAINALLRQLCNLDSLLVLGATYTC